jgi:exonuclease III
MCHAKSVDMNNPIAPMARRKGHGGTAIFWHNRLDGVIEALGEGSERIAVIKIDSQPKPIIIISAYCPCRGKPYTIQDFISILDEIAELLKKYKADCDVIVAGDFNASMKKDKSDEWSKQLQLFATEMQLHNTATSNEETYCHNDGLRKSMMLGYMGDHQQMSRHIDQ